MATWAEEGQLLLIGDESTPDSLTAYPSMGLWISNNTYLSDGAMLTFGIRFAIDNVSALQDALEYSMLVAKHGVLVTDDHHATYGIFDSIAKHGECVNTAYGVCIGESDIIEKPARSVFFSASGGSMQVTAKIGQLGISEGKACNGVFNKISKRSLLSITGLEGSLGTSDIRSIHGNVNISGFSDSVGTFITTARHGVISISDFIERASSLRKCVVMNLENNAATYYINYPFDSLVNHNGMLIGSNDVGLYLLEGDDDAGTNIDVVVQTPMDDFNIAETKRNEDVFVTYDGGPIRISVLNNAKESIQDTLSKVNESLSKRSKVGKGIRHRFWSIKIINHNGSRVNIDEIELRPIKLGRII